MGALRSASTAPSSRFATRLYRRASHALSQQCISHVVRISVKTATCFGVKVATPRSAATLVGLGWVSGFFPSSFLSLSLLCLVWVCHIDRVQSFWVS